MAWIESHTDLSRHPKLMLFRKKMRWSKAEAIGFLHMFWWTVLEYAPNGVISTLSPEILAESLEIDPVLFSRITTEMEAVGFLDRVDKSVRVHDWLDFAGQFLRGSKYRRQPEKWLAVCEVYKVSPESFETVARQSRAPYLPNQPVFNKKKLSASEATAERLIREKLGKG